MIDIQQSSISGVMKPINDKQCMSTMILNCYLVVYSLQPNKVTSIDISRGLTSNVSKYVKIKTYSVSQLLIFIDCKQYYPYFCKVEYHLLKTNYRTRNVRFHSIAVRLKQLPSNNYYNSNCLIVYQQ